MNKFNIYTDIEDQRWPKALDHLSDLIEKVKESVLQEVGKQVDFLDLPIDFNLNVCLSNDQNIQKLNAQFRHMDKPTNVLSFAQIDDPEFEDLLRCSSLIELGDIMVAFETMQQEAKSLEISLHDHFCHLLAHGILHILGYDHMTEQEASVMESAEIKILEKLNIANPYKEE